MPVQFEQLWAAYPTEARQVLFAQLGGGWPALTDNRDFENTCTIRLSVGMSAVGQIPPEDLWRRDGRLTTGQGGRVIVKVSTAKEWLERVLGQSTWGISKQVGTDAINLIPRSRGIVLYRVDGGGASGHVDLWNGAGCRVDCHSSYARNSTFVELWEM
jgi:hypothetical protein